MILPSPVMISMAISTRVEEEGKTERRADSTDDEHEEHVIPVIARVTVISWRRRILVLACCWVVMMLSLAFYLTQRVTSSSSFADSCSGRVGAVLPRLSGYSGLPLLAAGSGDGAPTYYVATYVRSEDRWERPVATRHQRASLVSHLISRPARGQRKENLGARPPTSPCAMAPTVTEQRNEKSAVTRPKPQLANSAHSKKDKRAGTTSNLHLGTTRQKR